MTLTRNTNWPELLHEFVCSRLTLQFAWGSNDCALFVADAINAMTGTDLGTGLRGAYTSLAGAVTQMAKLTGKTGASVEDVAIYFASHASMTECKNSLFARRGDVVLFDGSDGPAMGICALDGRNALFVSQTGLNQMSVRQCRRAWHVG